MERSHGTAGAVTQVELGLLKFTPNTNLEVTMRFPLSSLSSYTSAELRNTWKHLNQVCFDGSLTVPFLAMESSDTLLSRVDDFVEDYNIDPKLDVRSGYPAGLCLWDFPRDRATILVSKDIKTANEFIEVVAHEMVHQAIAQQLGFKEMCVIGHGPVFMSYRSRLARHPGLKLIV